MGDINKRNTPRVFCMCRVSSAQSAVSDISIPSQKAAARAFKNANLRHVPWAEESYPEGETRGFFCDRAVSAWKRKFVHRPASSFLLSLLQAGDYLLIYSVDRGFRNSVDFGITVGLLADRGVNVRFIINEGVNLTTASGKLLGTMLAAIAQYSSDIKSERLREAIAMKAYGLRPAGGMPRDKKEECTWGGGEFSIPEEFLNPAAALSNARIFPYIRCSHISSLESGLGLAAQEEGVLKRSAEIASSIPGATVMDVYRDDAVSAFTVPFDKRPSGKLLCESIKPGDHVVVYRLDRAWRSVRDCAAMVEEFTNRGIHIHLVSEGVDSLSSMGKLHFYTMGYIAWVESHLMSKRSKQIAKHLSSQGRPVNQYHIGMKAKKIGNRKKLMLDPDEIGRQLWILGLRQQTGKSAIELSEYVEAWSAKEQNRRILPICKGVTISGCVRSRYWTRSRIQLALRRAEKLKAIADANGIAIPTPEELHRAGRLLPPADWDFRLAREKKKRHTVK